MHQARPDLVFALGFFTWRAIEELGPVWATTRLLGRVLSDESLGRVIVVDPRRSAAVLVKRALARGGRAPTPPREGVSGYSPLRLRRRDPVRPAAVERSFRRWDARMGRLVRTRGLADPVLLTNDPLVAGFADAPWASAVTYYATDDWASHPAVARWWPAYSDAYARIRARGRAVCAVSRPLLDRIAPTGPALVVPNGVAPEEWRELRPPPPWAAALPRPRLIYTGTLDSRIDAGAVLRLADAYPEGSVLLLGGLRDAAHVATLRRAANVHVHPSVGRDELARVVAAADVGVLPHVRTPLTEAMSPLKLFEYLAGGLPVAATDLAPARGISDRVVLVPPGGDFVAAVARALSLGRASEGERLAFVEEAGWGRRHDALLALALRRP